MISQKPALQSPIVQVWGAVPSKPVKPKKKLIRRTGRDYSQLLRRSYQAVFLLLNVWLGGVFYFWVRGLETGTATTVADPPAGIEGWLPIAGLMNLKYFLLTGHLPAIHPAAMFLLITFLAMSFLRARRSAVGSARLAPFRNTSGCSARNCSNATPGCGAGSTFPCAD